MSLSSDLNMNFVQFATTLKVVNGKLIIQEIDVNESVETEPNNREEWMIISDRHTPFEHTSDLSAEGHNWQHDRLRYTEQQIGEMPTWIKVNKEYFSNSQLETLEPVDINTLTVMQRLAYDVVNAHQQHDSNDKKPLCLIIIGVAGTGKSYLINALRSLLQNKFSVTATKVVSMQECQLSDTTGSIKLTLWEDFVNKCESGKTYNFANLRLKNEFGQKSLSTTQNGCTMSETEPIPDLESCQLTQLNQEWQYLQFHKFHLTMHAESTRPPYSTKPYQMFHLPVNNE
ncbi:hypothetical protein AC249_AIPGENE19388 [Exaiptasia diaphana]|nr:hypothetical protein AC249_AIPGENE19388 [Exaiptasia diaphana]